MMHYIFITSLAARNFRDHFIFHNLLWRQIEDNKMPSFYKWALWISRDLWGLIRVLPKPLEEKPGGRWLGTGNQRKAKLFPGLFSRLRVSRVGTVLLGDEVSQRAPWFLHGPGPQLLPRGYFINTQWNFLPRTSAETRFPSLVGLCLHNSLSWAFLIGNDLGFYVKRYFHILYDSGGKHCPSFQSHLNICRGTTFLREVQGLPIWFGTSLYTVSVPCS